MLKKTERDGLGDLLDLAVAPDNPETRDDLQKELDWASNVLPELKVAPASVYHQVEAAAHEMQNAIRQLELHDGDCEWAFVIGNMREELQAVRDEARARRKRGQPRKTDKQVAVQAALRFFSEHSNRKPSTDLNNPFHEFAESFYRTALGRKVESGGLAHHIKQALKKRAGD